MIDTHQTRSRQYLPRRTWGIKRLAFELKIPPCCLRFQSLVQRTDHLRALPARIDMIDVMERSEMQEVQLRGSNARDKPFCEAAALKTSLFLETTAAKRVGVTLH